MAMPQAKEQISPPQTDTPYPDPKYAWFVVGVLMLLYTFSFIDRIIVYLMVEPIKRDMELSDLQVALLLGPGFAILYAFLGVPFGRMADRMSRRALMAAGLFFWTMMTAGSGIAKNFMQLVGLRVGVGVGEATLSPAAYSMIADYFPPSKHGRAFSLYAMGITIGAGLASGVGGVVVGLTERVGAVEIPIVGQIYSWQVAFLIIGLVGLAPLLLLIAVKEPVRRGITMVKDSMGRSRVRGASLGEYFSFQKLNLRTITCHHVGTSILAFSAYGVGAWAPAFMVRIHEWPYERIGILFMLHVILMGCGGMLFGGWLADRMYRNGQVNAPMKIGLWSAILAIPTGTLYPLMPNGWLAWSLMVPTYFIASMPTGVLAAAIQNINPGPMRGTASAVLLMVTNFIGQAFGPIGIAVLTDSVFKDRMMLPYSMTIVTLVCHLIAVPAFWYGIGSYEASVKRAQDYAAATA